MALLFYFQKEAFLEAGHRSLEGIPFTEGIPLIFKGVPLLAVFIFIQFVMILSVMDWNRWCQRIHFDFFLINAGMFATFFFWTEAHITASMVTLVVTSFYTITVLLRRAFDQNPQTLSPSLPNKFFVIAIVPLLFLYFIFILLFPVFPVVDIGKASIIGASLLRSGQDVYGNFPEFMALGDTYGPAMYLFYLPFDIVFPWQDGFLGARYASIFSLVALLVTTFFIGQRFYKKKIGLVIVFVVLSFPGSLLPASLASNDLFAAWIILLVFLLAGRPMAQGTSAAISVLMKWFSLPLVPLFSKIDNDGLQTLREADWTYSPRRIFQNNKSLFWPFFVAVLFLLLLSHIISPGIEMVLERTFGYQLSRVSPFSLWWYMPDAKPFLQPLLVALVIALGLAPFFIRQKLSISLSASLAVIMLILFQISLSYWFYTFFIWFYPLLVIALLQEPVREKKRKTPS